jgi:para-nitrobenzyl esterase
VELDCGRSEAGGYDVQLLVNLARSGDPNDEGLPAWPAFTNAERKVQYLGDPITVGGVANIHGLSVFDSVDTAVRREPFAAR